MKPPDEKETAPRGGEAAASKVDADAHVQHNTPPAKPKRDSDSGIHTKSGGPDAQSGEVSQSPPPPDEIGGMLDEFRVDLTADPLDDLSPLNLAALFVMGRHRERSITVRYVGGEWWCFGPQGYTMVSPDEMRAALYKFLSKLRMRRNGGAFPLSPSRSRINLVLDALSASVLVSEELPCWADGRDTPEAKAVIAFRNGLLGMDAFCRGKVELNPPTPLFITRNTMPFDFDSGAVCPRWTQFLQEVFGGDEDSAKLAQEWFGYNMASDNSHEKFMVLVGPPRSGKGTFLVALQTVLGEQQVATTTFSKLAGRFGFQPLWGKLAAIMPDAHLGGSKKEATGALEMLKSITGGDRQAIDRKFKEELPSEVVTARFTIAVNELPEFPDTAGALASRLLLLHFPVSFVGREDTTLKEKLRDEAAGIVRWALDGLKRLRQSGSFTTPAASQARATEFQRLVAPVQGFIQACCRLGADLYVEKGRLYLVYCEWCASHDIEPYEKGEFTKKLKAAHHGVDVGKRGPKGQQKRVYTGIALDRAGEVTVGSQPYPTNPAIKPRSVRKKIDRGKTAKNPDTHGYGEERV